jgi:Ser/Thr protein kinase RdoA (MazF antagonist)
MNEAFGLLPPLNFEKLDPLMQELFNVGEIQGHTFVHGGYMGQNYKIDTQHGVYFLKQYQNRINTIIHEIKTAEDYFASQGLPVITPLKDIYNREAFWLEGNWYSLFPFVIGTSPTFGEITQTQIRSLAHMLARFHEAGHRFPNRPFQLMRVGNRRKFILEKTELYRLIMQKRERNTLDERMLEVLAKKERLVQQNTLLPQNIPLSYNCLLHGDFQYLNTFANEQGEIERVYDLERASLGPAAYELVRSLIINCFDDAWETRNFSLGRLYISTYRESAPLKYEEFCNAVRLYAYSIIHMTWIETRYIVFGIQAQIPIFERHAKRLDQLTSTNLDVFCEKIWN